MIVFRALFLIAFFLLPVASSAQSAIPATQMCTVVAGGSYTASTCAAAAAQGVKNYTQGSPSCSPTYPAVTPCTMTFLGSSGTRTTDLAASWKLSCPDGYTLIANAMCQPPPDQCVAPLKKDASGNCSCPSGTSLTKDANGVNQCKPANFCAENKGKFTGSGMQLDYGQRSPGQLGRMVGSGTSGCHAASGCVIQGTVAGCWGSSSEGSAGCLINTPTYTGERCSETDNTPQQCPSGSRPSEYAAGVCIPDEKKCPAGSTPSQYAEGVCIPDENKCPAGQSPSKYAAGVCVPDEDPNADGNNETGKPTKCPAGRVESRYVSGLCIPADTTVGDGNGGGGGTTCKDGKCTTTNPDGSKDEETEGEFCKKNPDAAQCKKSGFSGSCGSWACEGDAIQCAMAKEQHKTNCKLLDDKASHPLTQAALDGTDEHSAEKLKGKAEQISVGTNFNQAGFGWAKGCPADPEIPLGFVSQSFTIPFSRICGPLEALSLAGVGITLLGCLVWVIGGKKA